MAAVALTAAIVVAGCGRATRPAAAEWSARWDTTRDLVPDRTDLGAAPGDETCEAVLVDLREASVDLLPGPDEGVDELAESWITTAEGMFFECFDTDTGADGVAEAYDRLDLLEAEIDVALDATTEPGRS